MAFTEDFSAFFRTADFAVTAAWTPASTGIAVSVTGIFDDANADLGMGGKPELTSSSPRFECAEADVSGIVEDDDVVVNDLSYMVAWLDADGTGVVVVHLKLAPTWLWEDGSEIELADGSSLVME